MDSYTSRIEMKSLSVAILDIFAKIAFWPLNLGPRSKVMAPNKSPYMVSYMSIIEMKTISRCFGYICENCILSSLHWAKVKGHGTKRKPIYGFLYAYNRNEVSICCCFGYICETRIWSARGNYALNHVLLVHIMFQNKTTKKKKKSSVVGLGFEPMH